MIPTYPALLAGVLWVAAGQSQVPQTRPVPPAAAVSTASIEGMVVRLGSQDPISGADVELSRVEGTTAAPMPRSVSQAFAQALLGDGPRGPQPPPQLAPEVKYVKTGDDGKFRFENLKEGKYRLVAIRIGGAYFPAEYGQHDPRGRGFNFAITEGQAMKDARLEMAPTVVITGRVLDGDGEPMGHVSVVALEPQYQQGQRILNIMQSTTTDERGNYHLFWLAPGRYYVAAKVEDTQKRTIPIMVVPAGRSGAFSRTQTPVMTRRVLETGEIVEETYALVYSGDVLTPERAQPVDVQPGATVGGVDIHMGVGILESHQIRGVVLGPDGQLAKGAAILALPRQWSPNVMMLRTTTDGKGAFDLAGAVPGAYAIYVTVSTPKPIDPELAAELERAGVPLSFMDMGGVTSGLGFARIEMATADVNGLTIVASAGINLAGRITVEERAGDKDPDLRSIRINLRRDPDLIGAPPGLMPPAEGTPAPAGVSAGSSINIFAGPGDYRITVSGLPANTYLKAIRMGAEDVLKTGLHIGRDIENALEVAIGADPGEIGGTVFDSNRIPIPNAVVVLEPNAPASSRRPDLYKNTLTDANGKFRMENIPPGAYQLFSWEYAVPDSWQDAEFMQAYGLSGKSIEVREHSKQELELSVIAPIPSSR